MVGPRTLFHGRGRGVANRAILRAWSRHGVIQNVLVSDLVYVWSLMRAMLIYSSENKQLSSTYP